MFRNAAITLIAIQMSSGLALAMYDLDSDGPPPGAPSFVQVPARRPVGTTYSGFVPVTSAASTQSAPVQLASAQAAPTQAPHSTPSDAAVCDSFLDTGSNVRYQNCLELMRGSSIQNKEALKYTLQFLADNSGSLQDPSCAMNSTSKKNGVMNADKIKKGIKNQCKFVLNETEKSIKGSPFRSQAHYINLCARNPREIVHDFYMNKGKGKDYVDVEGRHSTVAGAFLTDDHLYPFVPFKMNARYRAIKKQFGGDIPGVRLVALNASNQKTDFGKPLHVSPYQSSWGCPSVGAEEGNILAELSSGGPSLVMNYGPKQFHQSTTSCDNTSPVKASYSKSGSREGSTGSIYGGWR